MDIATVIAVWSVCFKDKPMGAVSAFIMGKDIP